ncbi:uncharacterized protein Dana_GF26498 [Drosophila ananassae]|uniref:Reverse transcriptase domain-containing protein n=1 Tax=Drosophila ananassae TaxID=7217 RepID=A0A0P8ZWP8_DROAN|nr:uncharacterized protein Dana_GF26498 [Drosophila ananassae]
MFEHHTNTGIARNVHWVTAPNMQGRTARSQIPTTVIHVHDQRRDPQKQRTLHEKPKMMNVLLCDANWDGLSMGDMDWTRSFLRVYCIFASVKVVLEPLMKRLQNTLVVVAKTVGEVEATANRAIEKVEAWLSTAGLQLAPHKTKAVLISSRKKVETTTIRVGGVAITSKRAIKYLGVMLNMLNSFREHLECAHKRAKVHRHRLIPDVGIWTGRKHGEIDFYLTQALSGHEYRSYLKRFGHEREDGCPSHGRGVMEDAYHVLFDCRRFDEERTNLEESLEETFSPESMVPLMLKSGRK